MHPPISLAEGIASQHRTAESAMLFIHPTLLRPWKVGTVGRKSQQIGQCTHPLSAGRPQQFSNQN